MQWLYQPLLMLVAKSVDSQLAAQIQFLKVENSILRKRLPRCIRLTADEKRQLIKLGQAVGAGIRALITIVAYNTFRRWVVKAEQPDRKPGPSRRRGRPKTSTEIREAVLRIAKENAGWGYTRILGELKKLRIRTSRSNVVNILRAGDIDPKTDSTKGTWAEFLKAHGDTLWQCDFFSKNIITAAGMRCCYVLAFVHVATRRVILSPCSFKPDERWVVEQASVFVERAKAMGLPVGMLCRDRDKMFSRPFDAAIRQYGAAVHSIAFRSPNLNAYVERFVQTIQKECLDQFIVFGQEHFDLLNREFLEHYHTERPHQAKDNEILLDSGIDVPAQGEIVCRERLGGVLRHYTRKAA